MSFAQDFNFKPDYSINLPSTAGEKLLEQCSRASPQNVTAFFELDSTIVGILELNFKRLLSYQTKECCSDGSIPTLDGFAFQYVGVKIKRESFIYVNALFIESCEDFETVYKDWTIKPIIICDGGDNFWGALFNLEKEEFVHLAINGI